MSNYWKKYWQENEITERINPQAQVGRTINSIPVESEIWESTLEFIKSHIKLKMTDNILDLGAGNGMIAIPFSVKCQSVTVVDISQPLLDRIDTVNYNNIIKNYSDILDVNFPDKSFDKIILYFALQHFNEKETIIILNKAHNWLADNGLFYIGDIPDLNKIWSFFDTSERENLFFDSLLNEQPIVGTWYTSKFLKKAAYNSNYSSVKILRQPDYQINSHYRFDILLKK
jgi:ubiquinone/menaquinone biosynthesis C-methylase UbiE